MGIIHGVQIIVRNNNKILILKRSQKDKKAPGLWNLPGGKFEIGERWYNAAKRELFEETGLNLNKFVLLESSYRIFVKKMFKNVRFQSYLVFVESSNAEIILNEEHSEYAWVKLDEFEKNEVLCYSKEEIIKYMEQYEKNKLCNT